MCDPYSKAELQLTRKCALELGIPCTQGVLVSVQGPNLETRAEYRMLKLMGADAVSMSTVPEVLVAVHAGMKVLGFAVVTDLCLPDALEPVELPKIIATAEKGGAHLAKLIPHFLTKWK
jgi:purine-nucleoside phosphorylase